MHRVLQPEGWVRPYGYANGIAAQGRQVFVAGQVGCDSRQEIVSDDYIAQARQALRNIVVVLREAGAGPEHLVRMTWYLADIGEFNARREELAAVYAEVIGAVYPAMTSVQVGGFVAPAIRVEIEATAIVPV